MTIKPPFVALVLIIAYSLSISAAVQAREDVGDYSIKDAMTTEKAKAKLGSDVKFYFGNKSPGGISARYGEFSTNKKTNAFKKSDSEACNHAFLSAMITLKNRALREGGNAVINIKSNYKGSATVSNTTFKCGAGNVVAGVALLGTVVKLN